MGICPAETDQTEQKRRTREAVDQPTGGDARHPGADQGDALAAEEQPVIPVGERAEGKLPGALVVAGVWGCGRHQPGEALVYPA